MKPEKMFKGLKDLGMDIAYIENITNKIVLAKNHTDDEIEKMKKWLKENSCENYEIENPLPEAKQ